jgi:multicomponent Na+:H+ antiporter subunit G
VIETIALALMILGLFFLLIASIGFVRFPDIYCRLHITGVIDTLGVPLMLLGVAVYQGADLTSGKLILALVFLYMTSPLVAHLLARSALLAGREPAPGTRWTPQRRPPKSMPPEETSSSYRVPESNKPE